MTVEVVDGLEGRVQIEPESGIGWVDGTNGEVSVRTIEPVVRKLGREIASWMGENLGRTGGGPSLINRQAYSAPGTPYAEMRLAYAAVEHDDVIGGVADVTEGLMFQGQQFEAEDANETDAFNQIARDLNLDQLARQWHREEYIYSQIVVGFWWGYADYTPRTKTANGKKSKKAYHIYCPRALTFLDPRKVVPLQPGPFGQDNLAWQSTQDEYTNYVISWQTGAFGDALMREFFDGPISPYLSEAEKQYLRTIGVRPEYLIRLNANTVKRFTRTKAHYERFPTLRLKRTFKYLDLKEHLVEADRATLVGAANYILLVRQGSKEQPATQPEIDNLSENFKIIAKVPVITGDHRLSIDIITPAQEHVLETSKYDTLDRRLIASALGAMGVASSGQRNESTITIGRFIGRVLESRRQMYRRFIEENVCRAVLEHPYNAGVFTGEPPSLAFTPRQIQLDNDQTFYDNVLALRDKGDISRQTELETFGFDQATEALRVRLEKVEFPELQTKVPFNSPQNAPGQPGDQGGQADPAAEGQGGGQSGGQGDGPTPSKVSGARGGRPRGS